jgi:Transport and Golgi organisation 2
MCTVSIVPFDDGFRVVCNRDERRRRAAATPPTAHSVDRRVAIFPVDPEGGGTWAGVNDAGVAAILLNRTSRHALAVRRTPVRSRGWIVPRLLACDSVPAALDLAARIDPTEFNAFRVVIAQRMAGAVLTSDGDALSLETVHLLQPLMWTSSSLGDELVEPPRRRLFDRLVTTRPEAWLRAQSRFHEHSWPRHPRVSVMMERADTRTVSRTSIDVTASKIELGYDPLRRLSQSGGSRRESAPRLGRISRSDFDRIAASDPRFQATL